MLRPERSSNAGSIWMACAECDWYVRARLWHDPDAVCDQPIELLELLIGIGDVALQSGHAGIYRVRHFRTPRCQRGQDRGQTLRLKQSFGHVGSDEIVELVHQHRPAFAGRLSLSCAGRARIVTMDGTGLRGTARSERS